MEDYDNYYIIKGIFKGVVSNLGKDDVNIIKRQIDSSDLFIKMTSKGKNLLHFCVIKDAHKVFTYLLDNKLIDIEQKDKNGYSPVHYAAQKENPVFLIDFLEKYHVNPNLEAQNGNTPLHIAALNEKRENIAILLKNKANINAQNSLGYTPLISAILDEKYDIALYIIQYSPYPKLKSNNGNTALIYAVNKGNLDLVRKLIGVLNADPYDSNKNGSNALHLSVNYIDILKYLIEEVKVDPLRRDSKGNTVMHYAGAEGNKAAYDYLRYKCNVDPLIRNYDGKIALIQKSRCCRI